MRRVAGGESFVVTVNGRPVADVVPHRRGTGKRVFAPVAELVEAFGDDAGPDTESWLADLRRADDGFGDDQPSDPFRP